MKHATWRIAALSLLLWAMPARADNRIIVRTTLGSSGLQQLLQQVCGPLVSCSVVPGGLGDPLKQLFLVTTPLDPTTLLTLLRPLPGIVDAELDQLISLVGGLNVVPTPLPAGLLSDTTLVSSCGSTAVWNAYANQAAATIVHVQDAQKQFCGAGVVADIDTGVDPNHPAFAGVLLAGYDFTRNQQGASELNDLDPKDFSTPPTGCNSSACPPPASVNQSSAAILDQSSAAILDHNAKYAAFGHGTMVMGVIHLVAPKANLLPLKAFRADGTGYLSDILRAIYYTVPNGANVINMSFDFSTGSTELSSALDYANQSGLVAVASAGNDGQNEIVYPAALQSVVMGVASTNDADMRSSFSNYGDAIVWVAAPGEGVVTTYPFNTYAAGWGTSFSAPFVSGTSALLVNKLGKTNESQAAAAVANAVPIGADMGHGRLDILQALQALSPADFTLSATPATSTINAGQSATYTLTVAPTGGFHQTVNLTCSGAPAASTCIITPAALTLDGTNATNATVMVQTTARTGAAPALVGRIGPFARTGASQVIWFLVCVSSLLAWITFSRLPRAPRQRSALAAVLGLVLVSLSLNSCGGGTNANTNPPGSAMPPGSSSVTLSSLTLNPTSVNGGNPSTGRVTLSGPAPAGGTVISLSSGNTSVASVPAQIPVAAGATMATFQVTTATVSNSTAVTISASNPGGASQTASLTVTPAPASGPSLTSLTLNPTTVNGGTPSTGVVTLSAPAPGGGAVISLSSNNTAVATVPTSVTIPAGATGVTFTVSTSAVTTATPATISASYAGVTLTDSLTATPPGTPAGTYNLTMTGTAGNLNHTITVSLKVN
jgi:Subtilase family